METVLSIIGAFIVLCVLVIVHELGHFGVGKLLGFKINEFAVGMGPKLLSKEKNGTTYSLRAFPIGGMCAFEGEDEEEKSPTSFNAQPVWKRMLVVLAGPFMNVLFALVVAFILLLAYGGEAIPDQPGTIVSVEENSPAAQAGILPDDILIGIDDYRIENYEDTTEAILQGDGESATATVLRDGKELSLTVNNMYNEEKASNYMGISISPQIRPYTLLESAGGSFRYVGSMFEAMGDFFRMLFAGEVQRDDVAGPVGTVSIISEAVKSGFETVLIIAVLISVNLAVVNLLPFPALDGGRFCFMIYEAIFRKPVPRQAEAIAHVAGFVVLIGLMVFLTVGDISRLFGG
ncbi:MAG: site-2 protease family protein [Clostridia bacterium]|nr:site-2 protease family protein [Clostridia bacterium]